MRHHLSYLGWMGLAAPQDLYNPQPADRDWILSMPNSASYLTPDEYANFKLSQQSHYAGVGMELEKNSQGQIVCLPYPDSPAAKAGIAAGDILEAVDGQSTVGASILASARRSGDS
jgi:carboxyl-terminal processing protease